MNTFAFTVSDNGMAPLLCLGDDILLQILSLLSADELVTLRTTCKYLFVLSKTRYLWNSLLRRDVEQQRSPLPHYRRPTEELGSLELECLTRRALRSASASQTAVVTRLDQGRSVNFLRLVNGRYLLAALTKGKESVIALYSLLSVQQGQAEPVARATLPGPVSSGEIDVQDDQVVVALCFQSPHRMVTVMSLRTRESDITFAELARFDGLSHIRCLRNELIGCGVQGDSNLPCLINWKTRKVQTLPPSPEADGRCVAMALRGDLCVVARSNVLSVYSLVSVGPEHLQDLRFDHPLGSVAVSASSAASLQDPGNTSSPLHLLITSHSGLHVFSVSQDQSGAFVSELVAEEALKQSAVLTSTPSLPRFGASASHVVWTNTPTSFFDRKSHVMIGRISPNDTSAGAGSASKIELLSECKDWRLPSLNAMPVMDFDDGMGLFAIGNALGELAVCNYGGPLNSTVLDCLRPLPIPAMA